MSKLGIRGILYIMGCNGIISAYFDHLYPLVNTEKLFLNPKYYGVFNVRFFEKNAHYTGGGGGGGCRYFFDGTYADFSKFLKITTHPPPSRME